MSKFTPGKWEAHPNRIIVEGRVLALVNGGNPADTRLIAVAQELYRMLKEELIPTSDYGGLLSFSREAKVRALLGRVDGEESSHD